MVMGQSIGFNGTNCIVQHLKKASSASGASSDSRFEHRLRLSWPTAQRLILSIAVVAILQFVSIASASAATHIAAQNYTSNVTWTAANSPYILDGSVTVKPGATLTVEPGVVVKFNGITRWLTIEGTLTANGAKDNRIVFTSLKDDSVGGDDGGDGPTNGAPGDWTWILVKGSASLTWADVRYGGYGSSDTAYGAINVQGGVVTIDRSHITDNQRAGIVNTLHGAVTVNRTLLARNAIGAYTSGSSLVFGDGSEVSRNTSTGLWFSLLSTYTGPRSTVMDSDVRWNGGYGLYLTIPSSLAATSWPTGNRDNIYGNSNGGRQLYNQNANRAVDWKGNFWGSSPTVTFFSNPAGSGCDTGSPSAAGYLAYDPITTSPPAGPINRMTFLRGSVLCYADTVDVGAGDFSTTYIDHLYGLDGTPNYALLQQYLPKLKYDSGELYHVLSPAGLTDYSAGTGLFDDSNSLKDAQGEFAIADPGFANDPNYALDQLSLDYLGKNYPSNQPPPHRRTGELSASTDFLSARGNDDATYQADDYWLEQRLPYPYKIYGRVANAPNGSVWLQYWFFYYYNPDPVWPHADQHEGDWEMVQLGLGTDLIPTVAVYAEHGGGRTCSWGDPALELTADNRPVVYVAVDSHASFFGTTGFPGSDDADGQGGSLDRGDLQEITSDYPSWVGWAGRWGDSGTSSPPGPAFQNPKWSDPSQWTQGLSDRC